MLMLASAVVIVGASGHRAAAAPKDEPALQEPIQITSPLGRTGLPGTVRIVARLATPADEEAPAAVRFYVNGALIATDTDGPPYVAEWQDENPFVPCTLVVEADVEHGTPIRDTVELLPLTIVDASEVMSIGVDAAVQDPRGRYVAGLDASQFILLEDGTPQSIDMVMSDAPASDFYTADRQQPEHVLERPVRAPRSRSRLPVFCGTKTRSSSPLSVRASQLSRDPPATRPLSPTRSQP